MCASAIASSSLVVTPGATCSRTSSRVSPTKRPAARILTIWSSVLPSIRSRPKSPMPYAVCSAAAQDTGKPLGDLVDVTHAVDLHEQPALAVDLRKGRGLLAVDLLSPADHGLRVVDPALDLGSLEQTFHHRILVDGQLEDAVEGVPALGQHRVEGRNLRQGAGV